MSWKRVMQDVQLDAFRTRRSLKSLELSKGGYEDLLLISPGIVHVSAGTNQNGVRIASVDSVDVMISDRLEEDELLVHFTDGKWERWSRCLEQGRTVCNHEECKTVRTVLES